MTRNPRTEFSSDTKRKAYARSNGICECHLIPHVFPIPCGQKLSDGNTFYEHIDPDRNSKRNDIENCAVLVRNCWRHKTSRYDLPTIAKTDRQEDAAHGIKSRWTRPLPGGRSSNIKIRMDGRVVDRRTGVER